MSKFYKTELVLNKKFNPSTCRHFVNDAMTVLHCHHYSTLYTQLAMDCSFFDAKELLADSMEEAVYPMFTDYFHKNNICSKGDRFKICEEYFVFMGLGRFRLEFAGKVSGKVVLETSHVDQGWLKKWGKNHEPVNYISAGFIAAMFAAVYDLPEKSYTVKESQSIACGADYSVFNIVAK